MAFDPNQAPKITPINNDLNPNQVSRVAQENDGSNSGQSIAQTIRTCAYYIWPPTKDLFRFKTMSEEDIQLRREWKLGSVLLVFSRSTDQYFVGTIDRIWTKEENGQEWMSVGYDGKHKELQRWCKSVMPLKAGFVLYQRYPEKFGEVTIKEYTRIIGWKQQQWKEALEQEEQRTKQAAEKLAKLKQNHEALKNSYDDLKENYDALEKENEFYKKAYEDSKKSDDNNQGGPMTKEQLKAIYGDQYGNAGSDNESVTDETDN